MGIYTALHPDQYPGYLDDFGFHKIQRHTKSILISILQRFFDEQATIYKIAIPEVIDKQNTTALTKIFTFRDFPFFERKLPFIAVSIGSTKEKKMFVGSDNWTTTATVYSSTGEAISAYEKYTGLSVVNTTFVIAATSPEERMQLAEFINICFTHFYRWQYFYYDEDSNMFNLTPASSSLDIGAENEITDPSRTAIIYIQTVSMNNYVEYNFSDMMFRAKKISQYQIDPASGPSVG